MTLLMMVLSKPTLVLLDEHTAALDPKNAQIVLDLTTRFIAEYKLTTMMITHNMTQAIQYGNRLLMMDSGEIILDRRGKRAYLGETILTLTPKAFALLEYLMTHPDEVVSRERLLDAVWGWEYPSGTRAVDTRIAELRAALDEDASQPIYIETLPGQGYTFKAEVTVLA